MPKFKRKSQPIDMKALEAFASAADERAVDPSPKKPAAPKERKKRAPKKVPKPKQNEEAKWGEMDKNARPTRGINVRFNDYELELLRYLAKHEDRSIHRTLKRLLIPALEQSVQEVGGE